ncbi:class I SAM-dependent methyltransferase [Oceanispirochaeta sp.]|jgi:2-polyprenyl-3-methyl-5-hydroxy-6-metoxy-1,4-benzoquinol methylase|uniref:class I SAM-dependent methyltransferase n=1 Tax=Oceanispirochaeta sp. TaxID=2035350 RepID=UPI0026273AE4|nr:class I SAM-dependent methyltransferase [Oceanispirochaeta sp.]MDA3956606.1 class I SAM-dependent methyltransferase [Oceanispirochaeta sp.]
MSQKTFSKIPDSRETSLLIDCPSCGGSSFKIHWQADQGVWQICRSCSLILQNPQPQQEDILQRYDSEYFDYETRNEEGFLKLMLLGLKDVGFSEWDVLSSEEKTFLDIGCATGRLGAWLNDSGWKAQGVEVCREAAAYGNSHYNIDIFPGTLEEAGFVDNHFRFVHASHVIEHLNRPDLFLQEIYRILKPGGIFYCITPNSSGFQALIFAHKWRSVIADHLYLFSRKTLKLSARAQGFSILRTKTWGGLGVGYAPGLLKNIADKLVKPLGWGDVMMMVLQKPSGEEN